MIPLIGITIYFLLFTSTIALQCNPTESIKKVNPEDPYSYLYCNLEGIFTIKMCNPGSMFNTEKAECETINRNDDPLLQPQNQAPDDICNGGIPLTRLSAPVICNPSISSCPDGYICNIYSKTGTAYCCKNPNFETEENKDILCPGNQVTYFDDNALPKTCLLNKKGSCPSGFGCTLIGDTTTRCCGQSFGCPTNSAGLVNSMTGGFTGCDMNDKKSWPHGFICKKSNMFNNNILCSDTSTISNNVCNSGIPLKRKIKCSKRYPCPIGFSCENETCCPMFFECPVGEPLNKGIMKCSYDEPCPDGFDCVTSNDVTYCCPSSVFVCNLPKENGFKCNNNASLTLRYYFDRYSGTCKMFKFTQCGGNSNNFKTKNECENFCQYTQCHKGGIPHRQFAANTYCSTLINQNINTCPFGYTCTDSILNSNAICCPIKEDTCNEVVTAGIACFNSNTSFLRFYYDSEEKKCKPFHFFGCNGNNNRFLSINECEETCVLTFANVCNGMAPLIAPNHELAECSDDFPCPDGYICNNGGNCCPEPQLACQTHVSLGSTCSKYKAEKAWYWDDEHAECKQFLFNGCGGSPNRFFSKSACLEACTKPVGECPSGMNPYRSEGMVQECTLNIASSCPSGYSCVTSTAGVPICCQSVAKCPAPRKAYIIPGSDSFVACTPESNTCPRNYDCIESDKVNGFFLCCSSSSTKKGLNIGGQSTRTLPLRQKVGERLTCPDNLENNGIKCKINGKNVCENGYTCMGSGLNGVCCKGIPTCKRNLQAVLLGPKQVQLCGKGLVGCPRGSACAISSIKGVNVCCKTNTFFGNKGSLVPKCKGNKIPFYELGSRTAKSCEIGIKNTCPKDYICQETSDDEFHCCPSPDQCPNKGVAYIINGKALACNIDVNNCPSGYKCEGDPDTAICCKRPLDGSSCPDNRKAYTMAGRPLVCPKGSKTCPNGYSCISSLMDDKIHVCCEDGPINKLNLQPNCYQGEPYKDLFTQSIKECTREFNTCPVGYDCDESTIKGKWICCSTKLINKQYEGYCPIGQIPYVGMNSPEPPSCHMTLTPCPTSGAYTCVYSAQKQNSYCCAPLESAVFLSPNKNIPLPNNEDNFNSNIDEEIGCPTGSKPLLEFGMPKRCSVLDVCPIDYVCKQNKHDSSVWQCCSNIIIIKSNNYGNENSLINLNNNQFNQFGGNNFYGNEDSSIIPNNNMNFMSPLKGGQLVLRAGMSSSDVEELDASKGCPNGFSAINNKCKKMYYLGQRGCQIDEQCSLTTQYAYCNKEYCACPHDKLIYNAKCVENCPLGFLNIAGRCHDITTVMLMDSVDERKNGTIGGFCLDTVVADEQCLVKNSFCSEKSITCQCKPGYELEVNFDNINDKGSCTEFKESKFTQERLNDYLKPQNQEPELFYVMEMRDEEETITSKTPKLS
ncbi:Proteinase inhibitor I2, Kunitz metazoa domain and Chitin binding domain and EB domain and Cysteine-rich repeat and Lustrin, cysteine-rich repeated domain-containing protein [Strongyloides ratti]|uniref:Proteinase inhibitor I2, Kunitz metazoa domain and Chitin binding domain and EB domain and Cysteine-rich repeat and Lustrin, cysteine-rich repeated domain-containing protein n=1 Tax=Strongyloides ratti TaxID=34506 RepID=A0A090N0B8_STRRB|nr:Proteinase inhibitor I2, Kunitz metazoa domain and Chitin binding domain and EB domain and Cysteine-rich repeat and Lustrin, cysteine-rich repeated domain-containing protein [Strongyloides ratti]CEF70412.1 Proteinase inhibitor I2, Kunitz metazoa domain and Chitin binding domain and EB domain and Cysteine-rich repeat and Lustrin, cysteine-rich repeated domain-containing protein [Strongyloides ratti]